MRLRNKKTGEIREWQKVGAIDYGEMNEVYEAVEYNSLAELNDEWEDYKPKEPLIKDEKVRKVVRAWAEAVGINPNKVRISVRLLSMGLIGWSDGSTIGISIDFPIPKLNELKGFDGICKSIEELCGEEDA